jgi:hypothetical protein
MNNHDCALIWPSLEAKALIGNSFTVTPQSHFVTFCKG